MTKLKIIVRDVYDTDTEFTSIRKAESYIVSLRQQRRYKATYISVKHKKP